MLDDIMQTITELRLAHEKYKDAAHAWKDRAIEAEMRVKELEEEICRLKAELTCSGRSGVAPSAHFNDGVNGSDE